MKNKLLRTLLESQAPGGWAGAGALVFLVEVPQLIAVRVLRVLKPRPDPSF